MSLKFFKFPKFLFDFDVFKPTIIRWFPLQTLVLLVDKISFKKNVVSTIKLYYYKLGAMELKKWEIQKSFYIRSATLLEKLEAVTQRKLILGVSQFTKNIALIYCLYFCINYSLTFIQTQVRIVIFMPSIFIPMYLFVWALSLSNNVGICKVKVQFNFRYYLFSNVFLSSHRLTSVYILCLYPYIHIHL